jgi:hypothetical protein
VEHEHLALAAWQPSQQLPHLVDVVVDEVGGRAGLAERPLGPGPKQPRHGATLGLLSPELAACQIRGDRRHPGLQGDDRLAAPGALPSP